jgi:hypothetical protein
MRAKLSWILGGVVVAAMAVFFIFMSGKSQVIVIGKSGDDSSNTSNTIKAITVTSTGSADPANNDSDQNLVFSTSVLPMYPSVATPMNADEKIAYDAEMLALANLPVVSKKHTNASTTSPTVYYTTSTVANGWPVKSAAYPNEGALLPSHRIVAYYGNFYSKQMGVLGQYPEPQVLAMLASTSAI